jgi:hypothetical protein
MSAAADLPVVAPLYDVGSVPGRTIAQTSWHDETRSKGWLQFVSIQDEWLWEIPPFCRQFLLWPQIFAFAYPGFK